MSSAEPSVVWLGKERVNKLGGEWSFLSIGSLKAAWAPHADIICAGFTYVINAGAFVYDKSPDIVYLDIPVVDSRESDLGQYFEECHKFIDSARAANGQVLVHCQAGRSRSATLVCSYLISKGGMSVEEAIRLVRAARPIAQPNPSFMEQLQALVPGACVERSILQAKNFSPCASNIEILDGAQRHSGVQAWIRYLRTLVQEDVDLGGVDDDDDDDDAASAGEFV